MGILFHILGHLSFEIKRAVEENMRQAMVRHNHFVTIDEKHILTREDHMLLTTKNFTSLQEFLYVLSARIEIQQYVWLPRRSGNPIYACYQLYTKQGASLSITFWDCEEPCYIFQRNSEYCFKVKPSDKEYLLMELIFQCAIQQNNDQANSLDKEIPLIVQRVNAKLNSHESQQKSVGGIESRPIALKK